MKGGKQYDMICRKKYKEQSQIAQYFFADNNLQKSTTWKSVYKSRSNEKQQNIKPTK